MMYYVTLFIDGNCYGVDIQRIEETQKEEIRNYIK